MDVQEFRERSVCAFVCVLSSVMESPLPLSAYDAPIASVRPVQDVLVMEDPHDRPATVCQVPSSRRYLLPVLSSFGRKPCMVELAFPVVTLENVMLASVIAPPAPVLSSHAELSDFLTYSPGVFDPSVCVRRMDMYGTALIENEFPEFQALFVPHLRGVVTICVSDETALTTAYDESVELYTTSPTTTPLDTKVAPEATSVWLPDPAVADPVTAVGRVET